jgi:hypothetical protein
MALRCLICMGDMVKDEPCLTCRMPGTAAVTEWDVTLTVNWVELTVLCLAASRLYELHGEELPDTQHRVLQAIIQRLYQHRPDASAPPLTLEDALREMTHGAELPRSTGN